MSLVAPAHPLVHPVLRQFLVRFPTFGEKGSPQVVDVLLLHLVGDHELEGFRSTVQLQSRGSHDHLAGKSGFIQKNIC